ncbi:patatin-like phospholipase family protein [Steroidobacter sp.]|uniref:patatin-like phospholipase family protein n=1 Tax=Steroidobacter sp. TaxID=1978227 RepID=UPI001A5B43D4|nr:patatin-like phospholipase family protein [Steroidobacter sp.]MBL8266143.1 patatin-like phospholipase family protein [Steroidobacter sp.]
MKAQLGCRARRFTVPSLAILIVLALSASSLWSPPAASAEQARPRIGLVLSGGGARGAAHVGVLKVLDEMRIPVDAIAGTSMGAVVGGMYASGMPVADIEKLLRSVNWEDAFRDRPPREELGFRRKQDDREFLVRYALGVTDKGFVLPRGLVQGQKLEQVLRGASLPVAAIQSFDRLPIPFRAVATDLESGEAVIMDSGDLVTAMRASMSAPGVFAPVERDGKLLVDGGLTENLPVEIARAMQVDVLIVVDVSFPLYASEDLTSPIEVTNQAFAILIRGRTRQQRALLGPNDIVIEPPLGRFPSADFGRVPQALRAGETGARDVAESLQKLALSPDDYVRYLATRNPRDGTLPTIEFVRADPRSKEYDALVKATMDNLVGKPMDADRVRTQLSSLYALDRFESIDYNLIEEDGRAGLELDLRRKSWGPNYVRVGLNLEDNFEGTSRYNAALRFISTELNPLGAEWLTDIQIGNNPKFFTEFYQPLSLASRYFVAPSIDFEERSVFQLQNRDLLAEYRVRTLQGGLDVGREISNWGELRLGMRRGTGRARVLIGDPTLPVAEFDRGGYFARFSYDRLDSIFFPRHGQQFEFEWRGERTNIGSNENLDAFETSWLVARSFDRHTFIFWMNAGTTADAEFARPENFYSLGGFLNLSGLPPGYLAGPHYGIARLIYQRRVGRGGEGVLDLPAYAGVSFEAGNTWLDSRDASFGDLRKNASLFFGVDTPLGPVYLATGYDQEGEKAFYLFLGRTF